MAQQQYRHFAFLDGIRFVCALWVVFYHLGVPPIFNALSGILPAHIAALGQKCLSVLFNGTASVVVFFIISGFCIHFPYASGKAFDLKRFYLSRATRIVLPMLVAIAIANHLPNGLHELDSVLWSLYCEIIYYALYPLLRRLFVNKGLLKAISISFIVSACMNIIPDQTGGFLWAYGVFGTALLCLPMWLLGCQVAELVRDGKFQTIARRPALMSALRGLVLLFCGITSVLHADTALHLKLTMLPFSVLCAVWILFEFEQKKHFWLFQKFSPLGEACFSIYLVHKLTPVCLEYILHFNQNDLSWPIIMATAMGISASFYFLVERPAHKLSKMLGRSSLIKQASIVS